MSLFLQLMLCLLVLASLGEEAPVVSQDSPLDTFKSFVDGIIATFEQFTAYFSGALIRLFRVAYNVMALVGVGFYFTGYNKWSGRNLIISAVILAFASELMVNML